VEGTATRGHRDKLLALAGLALVLFLVALDGTVVGTAMPRIIAELNGFALYAWVTTAYLLAQTAVIPIVGKLGDIYGRKWLAVGGVAVFVAASALCGFASSMLWLIACRGLQGLGGGILFSSVFALIADLFPDARVRARYQGFLFTVFSLSSLLGPLLGGWITDTIGWRWVFYVNLPPGLLALAVLPVVLPQSARRPNAPIDYLGAVTGATAIVALLLGLEFASTGASWTSPPVGGSLLLAGVALAVFVPVERKAAEPILPLALFRNATLSAGVLVAFMTGVVLLGVSLYTPLLGQAVLRLSASASGVLMMPLVVTLPLIGLVVGPLMAHFNRIKPFILLGALVMTLAGLALSLLDGQATPVLVGAVLLLMALGLGMVLPATPLAVQSAVDPRTIGVATAALQFLQSIGSTVGAALIGTLVTGGYRAALAAHLPPGLPAPAVTMLQNPNALVDPAALQQLAGLLAGSSGGAALTTLLLDMARAALASAIREGFFVVLAASGLALVCSLFMRNLRLAAQPGEVPGPAASAADRRAAVGDRVVPGMSAITISREYGSGGGEIAARLAQRLGWQLIDHEVVVQMAQALGVSVAEAEAHDEQAERGAAASLSHLSGLTPPLSSDMLAAISSDAHAYNAVRRQVVAAAVVAGRAVIVGRGAQVLLAARQDVLHVRIVAPLNGRVAYVMQREGLERAAAQERITRKDRDRARFLWAEHQQHPEDAHLYDLVANSGELDLDTIVDLVIITLERKAGRQATLRAERGPGAGLPRYAQPPGDLSLPPVR
jgi:EmrB/QacA subfamily drug resistance transporter